MPYPAGAGSIRRRTAAGAEPSSGRQPQRQPKDPSPCAPRASSQTPGKEQRRRGGGEQQANGLSYLSGKAGSRRANHAYREHNTQRKEPENGLPEAQRDNRLLTSWVQ